MKTKYKILGSLWVIETLSYLTGKHIDFDIVEFIQQFSEKNHFCFKLETFVN